MKDLLKIRVKSLALIAILLLSIVGGLSAKKIAIIDAGSSGSRLHVYDVDEKHGIVTILYPLNECQEKISKGDALSSIKDDEASLNCFLSIMTSKYKDPNPKEIIELYVLATAGMRNVPKKTAETIYARMKNLDLKYNYSGYKLVDAMTISGQYEGLYAWIAANCRNSKLIFVEKEKRWNCVNPYGILEIGGASMQIVFNTTKDQFKHPHFGSVYSKSYLGGGVDQVFEKNKLMKQDGFGVALDGNLKTMISQLTTKLVRLGRPINDAIDNARDDSNAALTDYAKKIEILDTKDNFHPKMNAEYIAYVFKTWDLDQKTIKIVDNKSDWTEGAALDIVINHVQPEQFNYDTENPN